MRLEVELPSVVRRLLMGSISGHDPRRDGPDLLIQVPPPRAALLYGEEGDVPAMRKLNLHWSLELDPKTGVRFWKVAPVGCEDVVRNLEMELTHHFDDPLDVR